MCLRLRGHRKPACGAAGVLVIDTVTPVSDVFYRFFKLRFSKDNSK